jgi:hypothetical protein
MASGKPGAVQGGVEYLKRIANSHLNRKKHFFSSAIPKASWSIFSTDRGESPSAANPGIWGDDTLPICISAT